jgi:hypothetical protein
MQRAFVPPALTLIVASLSAGTASLSPQGPGSVQNPGGLHLLVAEQNAEPTLRIVLPGHPESDRSIEVLFPEHVTGTRQGSNTAERLYLFRPGQQGQRPAWRRIGKTLEYERDLPGAVHMLARATLEDDGVRFHYEFHNQSDVPYDMIYAVTDPRLTSMFRDVRLERTYVHHRDGFDLLASETPSRLSIALSQWLPSRYLASFSWPVPAQLVERRADGITYYNKSRSVDQPLIATLSTDHRWVVASFARETGNVWSNPELTCQHVDPQAPLAARGEAVLEVKILVFAGSLEDVLQKVVQERRSLR